MKAFLSAKAAARFRRKARLAFPREEFGVLLGEPLPNGVLIQEIYFPPDRLEDSDREGISVYMDWYQDAEEWSQQKGNRLIAVGDIHSHCYPKREPSDHDPSPEDWRSARYIHDSVPSYCVFGICRVVGTKTNNRASIKLWPLTQPVETTMVMEKEEE